MKYVKVKRILAISCAAVLGFAVPISWAASPSSSALPIGELVSRQAVAVNPLTHNAYIAGTSTDQLYVINGVHHSISTIHTGKDPVAVAVDAASNRVYVVNHGSGTVSVLDGSSNAVLATIPVGSLPFSIAIDAATSRIYVSRVFSSTLTIIDAATGDTRTVRATSADAMVVDAHTHNVFLLGYESNAVIRMSMPDEALHSIPVRAMHLWGMALDTQDRALYVARIDSRSVVAISERSHAVRSTSVGQSPCAIAIDQATDTVYVANYESDTVTVIRGRNGSVVATIPVGVRPQAVVAEAASDRIYVANSHDSTITVIDGRTNTVTATWHLHGHPYAMAVDPVTGTLYAALYGHPVYAVVSLYPGGNRAR
jgi:YVTN family beta-propeller protein